MKNIWHFIKNIEKNLLPTNQLAIHQRFPYILEMFACDSFPFLTLLFIDFWK
ncbi:hypothetical protein Bhyg_07257 [Pseudolycoriella hygida]|uniref:Uncharacterized protein n=1 Tax=Pseudolycoriella hygida TaxID=35572 RepID=A0A9Q0S3N1_9DIPT|nr:hypothetical protein Bhyg_07257 [Pseudolycoriella hygida]